MESVRDLQAALKRTIPDGCKRTYFIQHASWKRLTGGDIVDLVAGLHGIKQRVCVVDRVDLPCWIDDDFKSDWSTVERGVTFVPQRIQPMLVCYGYVWKQTSLTQSYSVWTVWGTMALCAAAVGVMAWAMKCMM